MKESIDYKSVPNMVRLFYLEIFKTKVQNGSLYGI